MLERLPPSYHVPVLNIMHCVLQYVDLSQVSPLVVNADVLRVVTRHINAAAWREVQ